MTKMVGHLVSLAAALDLEERYHGYSEIGTRLPGTSYQTVEPEHDGYESRRKLMVKQEEERANRKLEDRYPTWAYAKYKSIKGYQGMGEIAIEKIMDGYDRRQTAEAVKKASTVAEKMEILEQFHKAPHCHRKITALRLKCLEGMRSR